MHLCCSHPARSQVRAITEHRYTPDRYLYKEGIALADRLAAEEAVAAKAGADLKHPATPAEQVRGV